MTSSVYLIFALLACIGTLCSAQVDCFNCMNNEDPRNSDCWKSPEADTSKVVGDCETMCYSETFQSGGLQNDTNIWYIRRGCSDGTCTESDNCKNKAYGTCRKCCSGEKCNMDSPSGSNIIKLSLLLMISSAVLAKWID